MTEPKEQEVKLYIKSLDTILHESSSGITLLSTTKAIRPQYITVVAAGASMQFDVDAVNRAKDGLVRKAKTEGATHVFSVDFKIGGEYVIATGEAYRITEE